MKKIRKNYSLEFKIQAVSLSEQRGKAEVSKIGLSDKVFIPNDGESLVY